MTRSPLASLGQAEHKKAEPWRRLPDCNGFARWRLYGGRLGGQILASPRVGILVAFDGQVWGATTPDELDAELANVFERVDWETYSALLTPVREAWSHVGHPALAPAPVRSAPPVRLRKVETVWDELPDAG